MSFIHADQVTLDCEAPTREAVLRYLADRGAELGFTCDPDAVFRAFLAREDEAETGLIGGFAVPHAKSGAIEKAGICVLKLASPVEWPSLDGSPVDIALALYVPDGEAATTHLRLLSKAAMMLMDEGFRESLRASRDPAQIAESINTGLG